MSPGNNIIASTRLYGGTVTQFSQTIKRFGWSAKFVDFDDETAVKAAIDGNTRAVFCEAIANPGGYITDLDAISKSVTRRAFLLLLIIRQQHHIFAVQLNMEQLWLCILQPNI